MAESPLLLFEQLPELARVPRGQAPQRPPAGRVARRVPFAPRGVGRAVVGLVDPRCLAAGVAGVLGGPGPAVGEVAGVGAALSHARPPSVARAAPPTPLLR